MSSNCEDTVLQLLSYGIFFFHIQSHAHPDRTKDYRRRNENLSRSDTVSIDAISFLRFFLHWYTIFKRANNLNHLALSNDSITTSFNLMTCLTD